VAVYYNDNNGFCANWLRNLIAAGLIADGEVDEQSIEDIKPNELSGYTQCHFFAGIGIWSAALRAEGWPDDRPIWTGSPEVTEVITPINFYVRSDGTSGVEVVALAKGEQRVYRLNEIQLIHLASDATLQLTKRLLASRAASVKPK
jgi:hypothetical protein